MLGIGIILMATPAFQAAALFVSQTYFPNVLAPSGPPILGALLLLCIFRRRTLAVGIVIIVTTILAWLSNRLELGVITVSALCAVPISTLLALSTKAELSRARFAVILLILCSHVVYTFMLTSSSNRPVTIWLPSADDKYEARFYRNYEDSLALSGFQIRMVDAAIDIPERAVVIVPWATEPSIEAFLDDIMGLRHANTLTLVIAGEHTNYNGFADIINRQSKGLQFSDDTTVPPHNRDFMGPVWTNSLYQFPSRTALNRGASIKPVSPVFIPLLTANSIFSDPGTGDPLWIGDYRMMSDDYRGWTLLAGAISSGPLWVLIGDNSFLSNAQIIAEPITLLSILSLVSLWPSLIYEVFLLFLCVYLTYVASGHATGAQRTLLTHPITFWVIFLGFYAVAIGATEGVRPNHPLPKKWASIRPLYGPYDERSTATAIVRLAPSINASNVELKIPHEYITEDKVDIGGVTEIHIGHIKDTLQIRQARITNCGRTGAIQIGTKQISLMDAQFCSVHGDAEILLGTRDQAVALKIPGDHPLYLILDKSFLTGRVPNDANVSFIQDLLTQGP
jgi:hypothetical protein